MLAPMLDPTHLAPETVRPLRRAEYDRLVELGLFDDDERIELLRGALVTMSPQGAPHADAGARLTELLIRALGDRAHVRCQMPFAATEDSEPEPDIAVYPPGDYRSAHPHDARLVIEIADSSLRKDRIIKSEIYAEAGVPEYWLINLITQVVEVRTHPQDGRYVELQTVSRGEAIRPVAYPDVEIRVADFLRES